MKYFAAVCLGAIVLSGVASSAQAFRLPSDYRVYQDDVRPADHDPDRVVYHRCHGQSSGTAHSSCGTKTGGPSGGLF